MSSYYLSDLFKNTTTDRRHMPQHKHHCASCHFLGTENARTAEEKTVSAYVDLYIHTGWRAGVGTFTRRWGPGGDHYAEIAISMADAPQWEIIRQAAIRKGLLKP